MAPSRCTTAAPSLRNTRFLSLNTCSLYSTRTTTDTLYSLNSETYDGSGVVRISEYTTESCSQSPCRTTLVHDSNCKRAKSAATVCSLNSCTHTYLTREYVLSCATLSRGRRAGWARSGARSTTQISPGGHSRSKMSATSSASDSCSSCSIINKADLFPIFIYSPDRSFFFKNIRQYSWQLLSPSCMSFEAYEDVTGLRFAWNALPQSKSDAKNYVVPFSCLYQPLRPMESPLLLNGPPISCRACRALLNPYCQPDLQSRTWTCSLCRLRNQFAHELTDLPFEARPEAVNYEYILPPLATQQPYVFLFVVDLCLEPENLAALKESLLVALNLIPPDALVGFITFGKNVNVHEIGHQDTCSSYCFNGLKSYNADQIEKTLGVLSGDLKAHRRPVQNQPEMPLNPASRFIQQLAMCEFQLTTLIESLAPDSFPVEKYHRNERATGAALNVATNLLSSTFAKSGARLMLFTGGPCTYGPGKIVDTALKNPIRSHSDLQKDPAMLKQYKKAAKFYEELAAIASKAGHTVDIFVGSYDQVGLAEMECLMHGTGGTVIQSDGFSTAIFKQSLQRFFNRTPAGALEFGLNATLEIKTTSNLKLSGIVGHVIALKHRTPFVADKEVGVGGTDTWKLGGVSVHSTYGVYFEPVVEASQPFGIIQFITSYQHSDGTRRLHVTTSHRPSLQPGQSLIDFFDQEAAAVLVARQALYKVLKDNSTDAIRWCDKILVDLCSKFGSYKMGDPRSLVLSQNLNLFPQFMYHLRRSNFIQIFNSSPDETAFYRHCFLTEECMNSLIMIQPTLTSFEIEKEPEPVLLDSLSIRPDRILLLDTFFHLLIFHGSQIAEWRRQGYQDLPDYEYFKEFLNQPRVEAADILVDRFPLPRFIDTEEGGSQARFLMSKLNPTTSYKNGDDLHILANGQTDSGAVILTDDVSLQTFMKHVNNAVVKPT
ncbi:hypothetical protein KL944_002724 [Ogataea haglerorum]|nr:hypothetical protein KL944_002724 [Ogataea haglerorum]